ncbi:MAG: hypothetical protein IPL84_17440 [Chitinophagaceae bacterium]|nr:hypothetical protein [Chitinophagaceae bacterium]
MMGKDIIPLLVQRLMGASDFLALPACEQLVREKRSIITINAASEQRPEGEQGHAFRTVKL